MESEVARLMDANANRAREGLRVAEEYARFVLDTPGITARLKTVRHDLRDALDRIAAGWNRAEKVDAHSLAARRDTPGDVGTSIATEAEGVRSDAAAVAAASIKRVQEALRVLEEYGKVVSPETASAFERLRYDMYVIETDLLGDPLRRRKLREACLYVLVTESLASADALTVAREAVAGGADIVQMREKEMEDGAFLERAEAMAGICAEGGALFLINDRPHIARLVNADGIHGGQGDLPVAAARRILGPGRIVGKSTSAPEYALAAAEEGADYIGVGPVYATNTKQHRAAVGLEYVRWAAAHAPVPYFCIGSINRETLSHVLDAGARAVAVCTAIIGVSDIASETAWFREQVVASRSARE